MRIVIQIDLAVGNPESVFLIFDEDPFVKRQALSIELYGFSFLYGMTGTTSIAGMASFLEKAAFPDTLYLLSVTLILAGLGYKIAMVPFHFWCPDVYEGAPTPITAFLSVASKAAGFAALFRMMDIFAAPAEFLGMDARFLFSLA